MNLIGVIGGGTMGAGIAEVCAKAGSEVLILETAQEHADAAQQRIASSINRVVVKKKLSQQEAEALAGRVRITLDIAEFEDRDLVIEAAPEVESLKQEIFGKLDKIVHPNTVLATNTSSIPVIKVAVATERPERVVGLHFFNPVPVMPLVEVVSTLVTSPATAAAATDYAVSTLRKTAVQVGDRSGFIVNALLIPYLCSAIRMLDSGYATAEGIDAAMKGGCGYPMGPLTLLDTIGLDIALAAAESLYAEFADPHYAPPALLRRMVDAGQLGRKVRRGFYVYE